MHKYEESKTTRIMMATIPHVTAWAGRTKYHTDGFLFDWVYRDFQHCNTTHTTETSQLCVETVLIIAVIIKVDETLPYLKVWDFYL